MSRILVFAGTTEGYAIAEFLRDHQVPVHMCVATDYGARRLLENEYLTVSHERMDQSQMEEFLREKDFTLVIDATHPYAVEVTDNIRAACRNTAVPCQRVLRDSQKISGSASVVMVDSVEEAVEYLETREGRVLVTTGSKELHKFTALTDYENRIYARVLSLPGVVEECSRLGFQGAHLICMQGPFLRELNTAMLRQYQCKYLVTKEAGKNGGFEEKCLAARDAGAALVVIGRPRKEEGISVEECKSLLREMCRITENTAASSDEEAISTREITLVGIGMGSEGTMTLDGQRACREADCIIGGKRLVDAVIGENQTACYEYNAQKIRDYIDANPQYHKYVIALSGDVGFYSGARRLLEVLEEENVKVVCGISSLIYFMSRIHLSWEDAAIVSAHGRECNLIHHIKSNKKTFAILGTSDGVARLAKKLQYYGMDQVKIYVGEDLSYPEEKIHSGKPRDYMEYPSSPLSVVCIVNSMAGEQPRHLKDSDFIRGKAPMTKEEVRSLSVDKLELPRNAVCYDVGAGTGSVSMEMALQACEGRVYAVEKKSEAVELIRRNKKALALDNLEILEGTAPGALEDLPSPTHVFVGGSSGNLYQILETVLGKNPEVRIVINCITLETVAESLRCLKELPLGESEIVQISVAKSRELGSYHMMMGENPIYIISCKGVVKDA